MDVQFFSTEGFDDKFDLYRDIRSIELLISLLSVLVGRVFHEFEPPLLLDLSTQTGSQRFSTSFHSPRATSTPLLSSSISVFYSEFSMFTVFEKSIFAVIFLFVFNFLNFCSYFIISLLDVARLFPASSGGNLDC